MGASEIFKISGANGWRRFNKHNNCNILVQMRLILRLSNRFALRRYKTAYTLATLYRETITIMVLKLRDIILDSNRFNLNSICKPL